jgi:hypothetical protein
MGLVVGVAFEREHYLFSTTLLHAPATLILALLYFVFVATSLGATVFTGAQDSIL